MKRESTNRIRYVLEELLPPALRDSPPMRWLFRLYWGDLVDRLEAFRSHAHDVSDEDYAQIYADLPRIQQGTDNSEACIEAIVGFTLPGEVVDVGCGTGELLSRLGQSAVADALTLTGVDIHVDEDTRTAFPGVSFEESKVEALPFADDAFDTVICTHVLEHILDIRAAVAELRRVCRGRLIIVVPKEREHRFTFNPHLHFFPYRHSFLKHMLPVPGDAICRQIGRDFFYSEDVT